jgi:hypothetical protein
VLLGCLLLSLAAPRRLDAQVLDPQEREARALFERAVACLNDAQFAEARDLLRRSLELAPNPGAAFNLSVAYRGTGESRRAAVLLESLLHGRHGALSPAQRTQLKAALAAVRAELSSLSIEARGAPEIEVRVDGEHVGNLKDGERLEWPIDAGERLIALSAPDRVSDERRIQAARGQRVRLVFELVPTPEAQVGTLLLEAADAEHELTIVGVARARGRLERAVVPGSYRVRVSSADGVRETTVAVKARSTVRYRFDAPEARKWWQKPGFWVPAAAVVVAGAVVGGVLLARRPGSEEPIRDPVYGVVEALQSAPR